MTFFSLPYHAAFEKSALEGRRFRFIPLLIADIFVSAEAFAAGMLAWTEVVDALSGNLVGLLAEEEAAPELTGFQKFLSNPLILPVGLFFLFYLTFILPERRRKAEESRMMSSLQKNDRVVTVGGIHGTVVSVGTDSNVVTIRIDENSNTRIKVNRTAIATILGDRKENKDSSDKESASSTKDK